MGREPVVAGMGRRLPWSELLRRVFKFDVLSCGCGGRRRVLAFISEPKVVGAILASLHLPGEVPKVWPARAPPQGRFAEWPEVADVIPDDDSFADE